MSENDGETDPLIGKNGAAAGEQDGDGEMTEWQTLRTQLAVNATALVDSADAVTLPAVFRAFETEFNIGPSVLGNISLCQALAQALSAPFWGYLADSTSRRRLLATGCLIVGTVTLLMSQSTSIGQIAAFRAIAGVGLAIVGPIAQSLLADLFPPSKRGLAFGLLGITTGVGSMLGTIFATSFSSIIIFGVAGWRFAFLCVGMVELALSVLVFTVCHDPPRGHLDGYVVQKRPHPPMSRDDLRLWLRSIVSFFRIPTFILIVLQGLCGMVPWNAMVFCTLYLQYVQFDNRVASTIFSCFYLGAMIGQVFGGWVGDKMAVLRPDYGRIMTAQLSLILGVPLVVVFFHVIPRRTDMAFWFGLSLFCQGVFGSWGSPACNRPILSEIVHPAARGSIFAVLIALEGATGAFGAPVVGYLAEKTFGYVRNELPVSLMPQEIREENLSALAGAATVVMVVPWSMCFLIYGLVYITYPNDRRRKTTPNDHND